jgi:DNA polymerase III subunit delta'
MIKKKLKDFISPQNRLELYGYENYFKTFHKLFIQKKLPNTLLISGPKGSGKSTFIYHFINFIISINEKNNYKIDDFIINPENQSYKLLINQTHPNLFILDNEEIESSIKIEQIRSLLKFLNKSTYSSGLKIVLIDNSENLNLNSSNALLKALEEPGPNTFFFLIHNSSFKLLNTIKSRCVEFKIFFNTLEKKKIFKELTKDFILSSHDDFSDGFFYADTPGSILKYIKIFEDNNIDFLNDKISCISCLMDNYEKTKDPQVYSFISLFIEAFYNELCINYNKNHINYFYKKITLLKKINENKKFNLNTKLLFTYVNETLINEK